MHPKILERRKAVGMGRLEQVSPEEWPKVVAGWVSHYGYVVKELARRMVKTA